MFLKSLKILFGRESRATQYTVHDLVSQVEFTADSKTTPEISLGGNIGKYIKSFGLPLDTTVIIPVFQNVGQNPDLATTYYINVDTSNNTVGMTNDQSLATQFKIQTDGHSTGEIFAVYKDSNSDTTEYPGGTASNPKILCIQSVSPFGLFLKAKDSATSSNSIEWICSETSEEGFDAGGEWGKNLMIARRDSGSLRLEYSTVWGGAGPWKATEGASSGNADYFGIQVVTEVEDPPPNNGDGGDDSGSQTVSNFTIGGSAPEKSVDAEANITYNTYFEKPDIESVKVFDESTTEIRIYQHANSDETVFGALAEAPALTMTYDSVNTKIDGFQLENGTEVKWGDLKLVGSNQGEAASPGHGGEFIVRISKWITDTATFEMGANTDGDTENIVGGKQLASNYLASNTDNFLDKTSDIYLAKKSSTDKHLLTSTQSGGQDATPVEHYPRLQPSAGTNGFNLQYIDAKPVFEWIIVIPDINKVNQFKASARFLFTSKSKQGRRRRSIWEKITNGICNSDGKRSSRYQDVERSLSIDLKDFMTTTDDDQGGFCAC